MERESAQNRRVGALCQRSTERRMPGCGDAAMCDDPDRGVADAGGAVFGFHVRGLMPMR
nr:hypothetical protein JVH1_1071 [Rhodococcus sp. JVH1]